MKPGLDATDEEMCKEVRDLVYSDRQIQVEEIAQELGISHGSVSTILLDRLGMHKLTARWVTKSLSDEQMATGASVCSALLKRFRSKDNFFFCVWWLYMRLGFIIMSQRIKLSRQWVRPGSLRPKKFKTQPSAGKVMATVFWDAKGVIMLDFLPKRSTITGVYYANLLDQLRTAICEKCRGKLSKGVLLQQDNVRVYTCKLQWML